MERSAVNCAAFGAPEGHSAVSEAVENNRVACVEAVTAGTARPVGEQGSTPPICGTITRSRIAFGGAGEDEVDDGACGVERIEHRPWATAVDVLVSFVETGADTTAWRPVEFGQDGANRLTEVARDCCHQHHASSAEFVEAQPSRQGAVDVGRRQAGDSRTGQVERTTSAPGR